MKRCTFCSDLVTDFICKHGKDWKCYFCANRHTSVKIVNKSIKKESELAIFASKLLMPKLISKRSNRFEIKVDSRIIEEGIIPPFATDENEFVLPQETEGLIRLTKPHRSVPRMTKKKTYRLHYGGSARISG